MHNMPHVSFFFFFGWDIKVTLNPDSVWTCVVAVVKNAFRMTTQKRDWVCSTDTPQQKYNWVALLEQSIRGAISRK